MKRLIISASFPRAYGQGRKKVKDFNKETVSKLEGISKIKKENYLTLEQIHGAEVAVLKQKDKLPKDNFFTNSDGLITNKRGVLIILRHADCVPIFLSDPKKEVIGLVHSGWKGTVSKIGLAALLKMISQFGTKPKDIYIQLGPSAQKCCYLKNLSLFNILPEWKGFVRKEKSGASIDLTGFISQMFLEAGILPNHIKVSKICTVCDHQFFSWTRQRQKGEKPKNGVSIIGMIND